MTWKGFAVLRHLIESGKRKFIHSVVGAKDSNVINDYYEEISAICRENNIVLYDKTDKLDTNEAVRYSIAISWRWIIHAPDKLIVFHDSLLPKYRGFAPLVNMLINGEAKIGVTALYASEEYDKGDVIGQSSQAITYPITIADAIEKISEDYVGLTNYIFEEIINDRKICATKQDEVLASYSLWLDDEDYRIDWRKDSSYLKRFIDATGYPFKGACALLESKVVRILKASEIPDVEIENRDVGKVIFIKDSNPVIVCGKGLLQIDEMRDNSDGSIIKIRKFRTRFL